MRHSIYLRLIWALVLLFAGPGVLFASETGSPRVVASIKPVHSLVAALMLGIDKPGLILDRAGDAHSFSLTPSDARALEQADIVVMVGPVLELALSRAISALSPTAAVVNLIDLPGVDVLPARDSGRFDKGFVAVKNEHDDGHHDEHSHSSDPHVFISPFQVRSVVRELATHLAQVDPDNASRYEANHSALIKRIDALDERLRAKLEPVRDVGYIVFHDAYQGFEQHYGLNALGAVTVAPGRSPGARRLRELISLIRDSGAHCVFSEPQFEPKLVNQLVRESGIRGGELDPLGSSIPAGPDHWFTMMENLADDLVTCLAE